MRDLNDTLVFIKIVETGSFTAAANELRLPRSTISRRLQDLEARLGVQLLHRTTRRVGLTEAGNVYFEHCHRIGRGLDEAEHAVSRLQAAPRGWLRIAAAPSIASSWVTPVLEGFRQRFPEVRVELQVVNERPDLIGSELDIALFTGDLPDSSLAARRLTGFDTRAYASPRYIARRGHPTHPDQLADHDVLALAAHRRGSRYAWPMSDGKDSGLYPVEPVLVCNDAQLLQGPLLAGDGIVLACGFSMRQHLANDRVIPVMEGWRGPQLDLHAVFPRGRMMTPKVRAFIDFMVEQMAPSASVTDMARPRPKPRRLAS